MPEGKRPFVSATARATAMRASIRSPNNSDEFERLYRFRYRIYVEEMNRKQKYADHAGKRITDPLDDFATNLSAWNADNEIIGAVRINFARDGDLLGYEKFYIMDSVGDAHPRSTCITTRLMIAPEYRGSLLAIRLAVAAYERALNNGITQDFIDCNDHLVQFFIRLGYKRYLPKQVHEEYGEVTCMRLDGHDRVHLERVRSPFVESLNRWEKGDQVFRTNTTRTTAERSWS
jgi:predicted GNAT family N-acyltransferase